MIASSARMRRRRENFRVEAGRTVEPFADVVRGGEQLPSLAQNATVEGVNGTSRGPIFVRFAELPQLGAVELVRLAELVEKPYDLVRMPHCIARELGRDHEVDRPPVRLGQIDETP